MSVELQEAEGRVKAARDAEARARAHAEAQRQQADETAAAASLAREQAEAEYDAIYARHEAQLRAMRDRVFGQPAPEPVPVEANAA